MSRWAPNILSVSSSAGGGVEVRWEVDTFFSDSEEPEKVFIALNGAPFDELAGDETSVEIPADKVAASAPQLAISVIFWWSGTPPEQKQSAVAVPVQGGGTGGTGVNAAAKPVVTVVRVQARTATRPNNIQIHWKSNNYNDGNIFWGPNLATPGRKNIRPRGERYEGDFTAQPVASGTTYFFKVEVRNTLHSPTWISTTIAVRSAVDTLSVQQFLAASGLPRTSALAAIVGPGKSVRGMVVG